MAEVSSTNISETSSVVLSAMDSDDNVLAVYSADLPHDLLAFLVHNICYEQQVVRVDLGPVSLVFSYVENEGFEEYKRKKGKKNIQRCSCE